MNTFKTTAFLAIVSLGAIATNIKPANAQLGTNPWNGNIHDTSECAGYNSCYANQYGEVFGSNNWNDDYHYGYDQQGNTYYQLQQF